MGVKFTHNEIYHFKQTTQRIPANTCSLVTTANCDVEHSVPSMLPSKVCPRDVSACSVNTGRCHKPKKIPQLLQQLKPLEIPLPTCKGCASNAGSLCPLRDYFYISAATSWVTEGMSLPSHRMQAAAPLPGHTGMISGMTSDMTLPLGLQPISATFLGPP